MIVPIRATHSCVTSARSTATTGPMAPAKTAPTRNPRAKPSTSPLVLSSSAFCWATTSGATWACSCKCPSKRYRQPNGPRLIRMPRCPISSPRPPVDPNDIHYNGNMARKVSGLQRAGQRCVAYDPGRDPEPAVCHAQDFLRPHGCAHPGVLLHPAPPDERQYALCEQEPDVASGDVAAISARYRCAGRSYFQEPV